MELRELMRFGAESCVGRCLRLACATVGVWFFALYPAWRWFGLEGVEALTISAVSCLVPGCLVFRMVASAPPSSAQVRGAMLGSGLRLVFGLACAIWMYEGVGLAARNIAVWLSVFYFVTLFVETWLILPTRVIPGQLARHRTSAD